MAEKAFTQIQQAEAQAQALIKDAQEEAARITTRAEEETADAFVRISATCEQQASEKRLQAEAAALIASAAFAEETARQCTSLKQELASHKPEAIDAIIQTIAT